MSPSYCLCPTVVGFSLWDSCPGEPFSNGSTAGPAVSSLPWLQNLWLCKSVGFICRYLFASQYLCCHSCEAHWMFLGQQILSACSLVLLQLLLVLKKFWVVGIACRHSGQDWLCFSEGFARMQPSAAGRTEQVVSLSAPAQLIYAGIAHCDLPATYRQSREKLCFCSNS